LKLPKLTAIDLGSCQNIRFLIRLILFSGLQFRVLGCITSSAKNFKELCHLLGFLLGLWIQKEFWVSRIWIGAYEIVFTPTDFRLLCKFLAQYTTDISGNKVV